MNGERFKGMGTFTAIWAGQMLSMLGTGMTHFALTIWAWQLTGRATALALVGVCAFGPVILISPLAGAIVDRANRKLLMILSDVAAGLATATILGLYMTGRLEIGHTSTRRPPLRGRSGRSSSRPTRRRSACSSTSPSTHGQAR